MTVWPAQLVLLAAAIVALLLAALAGERAGRFVSGQSGLALALDGRGLPHRVLPRHHSPLSMRLGDGYPLSPTFGLPCPTTIFTFGIFLLAVAVDTLDGDGDSRPLGAPRSFRGPAV